MVPEMRIASTAALLLLATLALACNRGKHQGVVIHPGSVDSASTQPGASEARRPHVPADPFGASSSAYGQLQDVTNAALASQWDGTLDTFAPWLEAQTEAVERALALLKAIRVGPRDQYAVANGRIALVYDHIAEALTRASATAAEAGYDADWRDEEGKIWARSTDFWARCVRGCSTGGTHLDAWDLRCRAGLAQSEAKTTP